MFAKLNHVSRLLLAVAGGLSLLAVAQAYAEEEYEEVAPGYDQCIADSGYNDRAMADCTYQAVEYWDSQLNTNYNELRQYCNELGEYEGPEVKSECLLVIKSTQLVWIKYRDAMEGLVPYLSPNRGGTMEALDVSSDMLQIVQDQANLLKLQESK